MVLTYLRVLFVLLMVCVGFLFCNALTTGTEIKETVPDKDGRIHEIIRKVDPPVAPSQLLLFSFVGGSLAVGLGLVVLDMVMRRKSLGSISGAFLGLVAGLALAYALGLVVDLLSASWWPSTDIQTAPQRHAILGIIKLGIGVISCYTVISLILQTKDDIRFVIPYVEFAKQTKGVRPLLLDTSVIIDGRIADVAESRLIDSQLVVPRFVLHELQAVADSSDKLKRNRGRRGLDVLNRLQGNTKIDVAITEARGADDGSLDVDHQLVALATKLSAKIATTDYNLNKIAQLQGIDVINVNDLAQALRPVVLPGETVTVRVIKPGEELGQGVGYLDDGTMVVGEQCRDMVGQEVVLTVTSVLQTSAGRMVFGRREGAAPRRH
jgi:uncharacterized protein YacL